VGGGEDDVATIPAGNDDRAIREGFGKVEATTLVEIIREGVEDFLQGTCFTPETVTPVTGLVGGVAAGQLGPRYGIADFPQDAIQHRARIKGRAIPGRNRGRPQSGRGRRMSPGDDGLDERPLLIGEVHDAG
jgi:hypothetical protein